MKNKQIADILFDIAEFLAMQDVPFKPRAYEKAAEAVEHLEENVADIYKRGGIAALEEIPSVGRGIAEKIEEYLKTGKVEEYEKLHKKMPVNLDELRGIEGVGPKGIKVLYDKLGVTDLASLKKAARAGKIRTLAHFGEKSEQKILKGIEFSERSSGRFLIGDALPLARELVARIQKIKGVERVEAAGSLRRWQETIGDIDILVIAESSKPVMDAFVKMPEVGEIVLKGETKSSVRLKPARSAGGIEADLRVVPKKSFGSALQYFTGSKDHNVMLRTIAVKKKLKLNEYGLFRGARQIAGETEESIYKTLGVPMPIPEMRQGIDELKKKYRDMVDLEDLKGDFQTQTDWTDGADSIEKMALEARRLGHEYIAITDHTRSLAMTGGSDEKKLLRQMREIDKLNKKLSGITILKGAEVNILKDGALDIKDDVLAKLDIVGAAVHSHFNLPEQEQTARIMRAMENPNVDIIFHPTGRVLNKREPYAVDIEKLARHASRTRTVLEIDAHPWRLDLKDEHIKIAIDAGALFAIDTDAHRLAELSYLEYGIGQARRAGLSKKRVINTLSLRELRKFLVLPKHRRHSL